MPQSIAADADAAFVAYEDARVAAVDLDNGRVLWTAELGGGLTSNIALGSNSVILVRTSSTGTGKRSESSLVSISRQTGLTNWRIEMPATGDAHVAVAGGFASVAFNNGVVLAVAADDGSVKWVTSFSGPLSAEPVISDGKIASATEAATVEIIKIFDGSRSAFRISEPATVISFVPDSEVITGDKRGNVILAEAPGGSSKWTLRQGGQTSLLAPTKHGFLSASYDNFVYMISDSGGLVWKRRLPGRVTGGAMLNDSVAVFTVLGESSAFLIELRKGKILDQTVNGTLETDSQVSSADRAGAFILATGTVVKLYSAESCQPNGKRRPN